jgi:ATP-dependent metalloprotease
MPDDSDAGQTSQLPKDDRLMVTQKEFLADIDVALGGRVAEELIFGPENVTSGASSDLRKATATATRMVKASQVHPVVYQMVNMILFTELGILGKDRPGVS